MLCIRRLLRVRQLSSLRLHHPAWPQPQIFIRSKTMEHSLNPFVALSGQEDSNNPAVAIPVYAASPASSIPSGIAKADMINSVATVEKSEMQLPLAAEQDEHDIREKYRPFLRHFPKSDGPDWIQDLELDTVTEMARANLAHTGSRLKVLVLYGSLRKRSYSKLTAFEAARILHRLGCDVRIFNPEQLPIRDSVPQEHPAVQELRALSLWSDGHVWCAPEQHGNLTAVFKNQIDWIPLSTGSVRPTQGRSLSVIQVNGGSQSFNTVNSLRVLGRWMRMFTIPNQSSIPMAYTQFEHQGGDGSGAARLLPSGNRDRLVDCMEEFVKYTIIMRDHFALFGDRYSERKESAARATQAFAASALQ